MGGVARLLASVLLVAGLVSGCGERGEPVETASQAQEGWLAQDEYSPPRCPGELLHGWALQSAFTNGTGSWVTVPAGTDSLSGESTVSAPDVDTTDVMAEGGGQPIAMRYLRELEKSEVTWPAGLEEVVAGDAMQTVAERELALGAELRVKVSYSAENIAAGHTTGHVSFLYSLRPDGSAVHLWECGPAPIDDVTPVLDAIVEEGRAANHAEALRLLTDAEDPAATFAELTALVPTTTAPPAAAWTEGASSEPMWMFAPPEERANAHPVNLAVVIPDEWIGLDLAICTRTPKAWSTCVWMAGGLYSDGVESMITFVDAPDPVEVWLVDTSSDYESIARLASFPAAEVDRLSKPEVTLGLATGSDGATREAAVAAATSQQVSAELAEGVRILENNTDLPPEYAPLTMTVPVETLPADESP